MAINIYKGAVSKGEAPGLGAVVRQEYSYAKAAEATERVYKSILEGAHV